MVQRRAASEFPNDNPELHDGLVWTSDSVCGAPLPTLRLRTVPGKLPRVLGPSWDAHGAARQPESAATLEVARCLETEPPAKPSVPRLAAEARPERTGSDPREVVPGSGLDAFVGALVRVALDRGATRVAAAIPELIAGRARLHELQAEPPSAVLGRVAPWRGVLDGTSPDLAECGDDPLDVWAADLLASLLALPAEREAIRRSLRRQGVAAFGMRHASAA